MNNVCLIGRVTKDAELKTVGEYKVARFSLAVDGAGDRKTDGSGYEAGFFNIEAWGKDAEFASKFAVKGKPLSVIGSLKHHKWQDGEKTLSQTLITADKIRFVPGTKSEDSGSPSQLPSSEVVDVFADAAK